jgi:hypothetical protein
VELVKFYFGSNGVEFELLKFYSPELSYFVEKNVRAHEHLRAKHDHFFALE